jgi:nucleotide-binding universal stress UspA family protein
MTPGLDETPEQSGKTARIVAGIDGSPASIDALGWAARQAELTDATLEIVMTWDWPPSYGWAMPFPTGYDPEGNVRRVLDSNVELLRPEHPDLRIDAQVFQGHPAPLLIEASEGADLLVVGSRGHGEFTGMLIGSVSEYCATHAACPVLVHRVPA